MGVSEAILSIGEHGTENMQKFKASSQTAFIVGYTGESGKALVKTLTDTKMFSKVTLIGRKEVNYNEEMLMGSNVEQKVIDFDNLDASADVFQGHDVGYCCLGTTVSRDGKDGYEKVDRDYVLKVAELAKKSGTSQFHLVSSMCSDASSSELYSRVKGEAENAIKEMGFKRLSIYRPGLLMCNRQECRGGDWILRKILAPMDYFKPGTCTTRTTTLAQTMVLVTAAPPQAEPSTVYMIKDIQNITAVNQKEDMQNITVENEKVKELH